MAISLVTAGLKTERDTWLSRQVGDWCIYEPFDGERELRCRACATVVQVPGMLTVGSARELMKCKCTEKAEQRSAWRQHFGLLAELFDGD